MSLLVSNFEFYFDFNLVGDRSAFSRFCYEVINQNVYLESVAEKSFK